MNTSSPSFDTVQIEGQRVGTDILLDRHEGAVGLAPTSAGDVIVSSSDACWKAVHQKAGHSCSLAHDGILALCELRHSRTENLEWSAQLCGGSRTMLRSACTYRTTWGQRMRCRLGLGCAPAIILELAGLLSFSYWPHLRHNIRRRLLCSLSSCRPELPSSRFTNFPTKDVSSWAMEF